MRKWRIRRVKREHLSTAATEATEAERNVLPLFRAAAILINLRNAPKKY